MSFLDSLGTLNGQPGKACPKGESRLQSAKREDTADEKAELRWKKDVRKRDHYQCRWCHRTVKVCLDLIPERSECHHLTPRAHKVTRWDRRNGLSLCASCHEKVTGAVNEKVVIVASATFTIDGRAYPNGDKPVRFTRVA